MAKRTLTLLLAVCMVFALGTVTALADNTGNGTESNPYIATDKGSLDAAVTKGGYVKLGDDIDLGTLTKPGTDTGLLTVPAGKTVTLDLNGHTISGYLETDGNNYANAHIILNKGTLTIMDSSAGMDSSTEKPGTIVNTNANSHACTRVIKNVEGATLTITGGTITAKSGVGLLNLGTCSISGDAKIQALKDDYSGGWDNGVAAIENRTNGVLTISGGYFSSVSEAALFADGGHATISGGEFVGHANYGAMNGDAENHVVITGGTFSSDPTLCVDELRAITNTAGDRWIVTAVTPKEVSVSTQQELLNALSGSSATIITAASNITLDGNATIPSFMKLVIPQGVTLNITGESVLTATGTIENNGRINVSGNGFISNIENASGTGSFNMPGVSSGVYTVSTPMQLQYLSVLLAADNMSGIKTVVLANDITMPDGALFSPLGEPKNITFDGQGHKISGLTITSISGYTGLFVSLENSTVKDLTLDNCVYNTQTAYIGGVAGQASNTTFENVKVSGSISASGASYGVAAIAGSVYNPEGSGSTVFINCTSSANIGGAAAYNVGSMFGTGSGSAGEVGVYNCTNTGAITAAGSVGYIFGYGHMDKASGSLQIIGFDNSGKVNGTDGSISTAAGDGYTYDTNYAGSEYTAVKVVGSDGSVNYTDFNVALNAEGNTIVLLGNVETSSVITLKSGMTLDGNGYTLKYSGTEEKGTFITVEAGCDDVTVENITVDAGSNIKHGVQFYCNNGGTLSNVTVKGGTSTAVIVNGATNVSVKDSTLNPGSGAYATIEYGMGEGVETIPSVTLNNVSTDDANGLVMWADNDTINRIIEADASVTTPEQAAQKVLNNIKTENNYSVSVAINVNGSTPEITVIPSTKPTINVPDPHAITVVDPANGSIKTSLSNASKGAVITVTATPDKGYVLAYITVDGEKITGTTFTMPDKAVTVSAVFVPVDFPFADVKTGDWYYDSVAYVYSNGLMNGVSATTFEPNANMTRAMVWAILARIDGKTISGSTWADDASTWAMTNGVSDGTDPNGLVTREQFVTMLWRFAGEKASSYSLAKFTDNGSVSSWAATAMAWAVENGIITGVTDTTIVPQGTATRAQCAAMLMRFVENVK